MSSPAAEIARLEPWFHNLHLPGDVQTAPHHPLGDFPRRVWLRIAPHLPEDLSGWTVLDIGCNAGFYTFELARRGGDVTAIDVNPHYLQQAQWAAAYLGLLRQVTFHQMQIYDLARHNRQFDLVWFMGVFYHLRYPLLGLDIAARKTRRLMVFQSMSMPGQDVCDVPEDFGLDNRHILLQRGWPAMAFVEHRLADDPTNWWVPNHACIEALLRSSGLANIRCIIPEVYLCEPNQPLHRGGMSELLDQEYIAATGSGS